MCLILNNITNLWQKHEHIDFATAMPLNCPEKEELDFMVVVVVL